MQKDENCNNCQFVKRLGKANTTLRCNNTQSPLFYRITYENLKCNLFEKKNSENESGPKKSC